MSALLGLALGVGVLLAVSPFFWPRRQSRGSSRSGVLRDRLVQAGLGRVPIGAVALVSVILAAVIGAAAHALLGVVPLSLALAVVAAAVPALAIGARARTRRRSTRDVWPDVVDQIVSAIRSGMSLTDALAGLADSGPETTRPAFADFATTARATGSMSVALDELKQRLADPVADRIVETIRMAREVGGTELTTVLRALAAHVRREAAIRSEAEARQSWVVNAARLGVASPWVVLLLLSSRPEAAIAYNSPAGATLILVGLAVSVVAYRLMIRVGRLPEERRWFA